MGRVLIVDDEPSICTTLRLFLEAAGYTAETAANADQALKLFYAKEFDVVISDVLLPGASGLQLLDRIHERSPRAQVLMMTGDPSLDSASAAVRGGACDYLTKPVRKEDLLKAVASAAKVKQLEDDRNRLEDENRQHRTELEERVKARTAELSESNQRLAKALEDVRRSQQQLVRQERLSALAQMVAGVAHDFNNSLMPILGLSELLVTDSAILKKDGEAAGLLKTINSAAQDAREIVRRLREFYKPDDRIELQHVPIRPLLDDTVRMAKPKWHAQALASNRNIELSVECDANLKGWVNPSQMREVIMNLVMNACDAIEGGGTIRVGSKDSEQRLVIWVTDSGVGMSEETLSRCIEPFFTTKGAAGTGLGLSMCYGIVRRHGGDMEIVSRPGQGTTVRIVLPSQPLTIAASAQPAGTDNTRTHSLNILLVDDDATSRALVETYLKRAGHQVTLAASGDAALALLRQTTFDLLLTDRAMPGMSGDELAATLRRNGENLPIVMLTGFGDLMLHAHEQPDGVDMIVPKPATFMEVEKAVMSAYLWHQSRGELHPVVSHGAIAGD